MVQVTSFNSLPRAEAERLVAGWLGVPRWVRAVVDGRPYAVAADLAATAEAAAQQLTDDELAEALSRHPRIGERPEGTDAGSAYSRSEQAGVEASDEQRLKEGNAAYEDRFGRVFLVRAAGRSSTEILAELERRLRNDDATEREETVTALRDIALLRLRNEVP